MIIAGLFIFMAAFGLSLGPFVWIMIAESVPPKFVPYGIMGNWVGATIETILFPILTDILPDKNPAPLFLFFSAFSLISLFVNQKFLVETKNKTRKQVEA